MAVELDGLSFSLPATVETNGIFLSLDKLGRSEVLSSFEGVLASFDEIFSIWTVNEVVALTFLDSNDVARLEVLSPSKIRELVGLSSLSTNVVGKLFSLAGRLVVWSSLVMEGVDMPLPDRAVALGSGLPLSGKDKVSGDFDVGTITVATGLSFDGSWLNTCSEAIDEVEFAARYKSLSLTSVFGEKN